jgi:hypothetical protein
MLDSRVLPWFSLCAVALAACSDDKADGPSSVDPAALRRAAVVLGSCIPDDGVQRMLYGLTYEPTDRIFDVFGVQIGCLTQATDGCAAVARCTNLSVSVDEACETGCQGQVLTMCDDALKFQVECPSDTTCNATSEECVPKDAPTCDAEAEPGSHCDGTQIVYCSEGFEMPHRDCAARGLTCAIVDGEADCVGEGAACDYSEGPSCKDAGTLVNCEGGKLHETACASFGTGFGCVTQDEDYAFCGRASECDPTADGANHCEGTSIVVCDAGTWTSVDCTSLGFTACRDHDDETGCTPTPFAP